ncbi:MAG: AAA family ATPase, partial [Actinobacteria bacterium]|nr:AAA family ATPase [Actinomycetota bacterium]
RSGDGGFVAVFGEAGIGKSRLLREFTNHAPDVRTITAFCETYQATTPYFAARFLLRGALGLPSDAPTEAGLRSAVARLAPELLAWLPLIGAVAAIDVPATAEVDALDPEFRRARTVQVVVDLLDAALTKPVALIVDDAHWLDELSGELLVGIAAAARHRPWVVVLAGRLEVDAYTPPTEALDLALNLIPLDSTAAGALLTSADQAAHIRPDQRNAILQRSGGNPLFLEQLAARIDAAGATALPDSLETLIAAEIDALGAADRNAVRLAAVLGPIFDTGLLLELVGVGALSDVLSPRLARFLEAVGDAAVRFRNQTYRDVAYETLSFGRRRDLHGRALSAIEGAAGDATDDQAEVLSFHALHARDFARCWRYSQVAAVKAEDSYANVEAATLLERALTAGAHLGVAERDAMAATWEQLGDVSLKAGTFDRAKRAFDRARVLVGVDAAVQARLCRKEAITAMQRGQGTAVARWLTRGLQLVANASDEASLAARSDLRLSYGELLQRRRRNAEAMRWAELAAQDAMACGYNKGLARAFSVRGVAAFESGDLSELHFLEDALKLWEEEGSLRDQATVATLLGAAAYYTGRWDDAARLFDRARADYEKSGDVVTAAYGTCNLADILIDQGRGDEVVDALHEIIRVWRSVGHPDPIPGALINLGRCALGRGDLDEARARFREARDLTSRTAGARVESDAWLADCAIRSGDAARALATVDDALRSELASGGQFVARLQRLRGLCLAALDRHDDALIALDASLAVARERAAAYEIALAINALDVCLRRSGGCVDPVLHEEAENILRDLGVRDVSLPLGV